MNLYSVWIHREDEGITLVPGEDIPKFADGQPMEEVNECICLIKVPSWEDAVFLFNSCRNSGVL